MAKQYLDKDGLLYFWQKIKNTFALASHTHTKNQITDFPTIPGASNTTPKMDGTAAVGSESSFARGDHVHPKDTSKANLASPTFTGTPKAPTAAQGNNSTQIATTEYVDTAVGNVDVPTKTSELTNDSNFVSDGSYVHTDNNYTTTEKNKLSGIASGAEVNQNAFSNVKVGSTTVAADGKTDTLELVAGSNITLTPDATNDKVTIAATDTTYSDVTAGGSSGLMSGSDKTKLDGIEAGAEANQNAFGVLKYASNKDASSLSVGYTASDESDTFIIVPGNGLSIGQATKQSQHGIQISANYATTSVPGIISAADKTKLNKLVFDGNDLIDPSILPSYVDDVIEAYARSGQTALSQNWLATGSASGTVITPEAGKIYVLMADSGDYATNTQFRWGGTAYVKLADGGVSSITNAEIDTIVAS